MSSEVKRRKVEVVFPLTPSPSLYAKMLLLIFRTLIGNIFLFVNFGLLHRYNLLLTMQSRRFFLKNHIKSWLHDFDEMPVPMNSKIFDQKADLGGYLLRNKAKHHKNSKKRFEEDKVKRIARDGGFPSDNF